MNLVIPANKRIIVALDGMDVTKANCLMRDLKSLVWGGKFEDLFFERGIRLYGDIDWGGIFIDGKFHSIPQTVANIIAKVASMAPGFITLHCSGGMKMLEAAKEARDKFCPQTKLLGVTVLTSLDYMDTACVYNTTNVGQQAVYFAETAAEAGLDGVVCSAHELPGLMDNPKTRGLIKVVTGIRREEDGRHDQARVAGPDTAIRWGADYLVIGRPITESKDPVAATKAFIEQIEGAMVGDHQ
jgi:orotidine-5'-phosphate decarboxylase